MGIQGLEAYCNGARLGKKVVLAEEAEQHRARVRHLTSLLQTHLAAPAGGRSSQPAASSTKPTDTVTTAIPTVTASHATHSSATVLLPPRDGSSTTTASTLAAGASTIPTSSSSTPLSTPIVLILTFCLGPSYDRLKFILDGHSTLWWIHFLRHGPRVPLGTQLYGGQQLHFLLCWKDVIEHLRTLGIEPLVIFDGVRHPQKQYTHVLRARQHISSLQTLWYQVTQGHSSVGPIFHHQHTFLPAMAVECSQDVLTHLGVRWWVAEGEGQTLF